MMILDILKEKCSFLILKEKVHLVSSCNLIVLVLLARTLLSLPPKLFKMQTSFVHLLLYYSLIGTSAALTTPSEIHYADISKRCETRNVYFHYNDSTLGTMPSCSWDVMNFAAASVPIISSSSGGGGSTVNNRLRALSTRQSCPPGSCSDGPSTNYTVKSGDTLEKIAAMFDSGVCNIAKANNISNPDFILDGQQLIVPTKLCDPDNTSCRTPPGTRPCVPPSEDVAPKFTIQSGDTFFLIGTRLNITADSIIAANLCVDPGALQVGQVINIPICPDCSQFGTCKAKRQ